MQSLSIAIATAVTAVALATLGGIAAYIYKKWSENVYQKEKEAEYLRVNKILKVASEVGSTVFSLRCREWLRKYKAGNYAPFPHTEAELLRGRNRSAGDTGRDE